MPRALPYLLLAAGDAVPLRLLPLSVRAGRGRGLSPRRRVARSSNFQHDGRPLEVLARRSRNTLLLAAIVVPIAAGDGAGHGVDRHAAATRAASAILYIFAIPLGISDLAAGLIWLAIFEQSGFLNSLLSALGVIDQPVAVPQLPEPAG